VVTALLSALALAVPLLTPPPPPASVLVTGGAWVGSGVVWDGASGRVLTALHVVEDMPAISISIAGGPPRAARVVDREPALDLALLAVDGELAGAPPLGASELLEPGERVQLGGCPGAVCAQCEAFVIAPKRAFAGARYLALAAAVWPGASGGPVLDARGALVGLVDLALTREGAVALAIPVELAAARFPRGRAAVLGGSR
jgi:serine protease Do/serine protease DegQ